MTPLRLMKDLDVAGKTVLVRVDYNVPLEAGKVADDFRIRASLPTLNYLRQQNCKLILVSHLGRPDGKVVPELSLAPVATRLTDLLRTKVVFVPALGGAPVVDALNALPPGGVMLLENLRFDPREEAGDNSLAQELASLADVYINDAFAVDHRAHASVVGVAQLLPSAAGLLVEQEYTTLHDALQAPARPLLTIVGGAKVADKIELLERFIAEADALCIGGAMANTFLASQGIAVGASVYEPTETAEAKRLLAMARKRGVRVILPTDVVVATEVNAEAEARTINLSDVSTQDHIVDIGPQTIKMALAVIKNGGTVVWNGPVGVDEIPQFAKGTLRLARGIIASKARSIICGGDTADALDEAGLHSKFSFVSTGGGASLELLAGKELPGLAVLYKEGVRSQELEDKSRDEGQGSGIKDHGGEDQLPDMSQEEGQGSRSKDQGDGGNVGSGVQAPGSSLVGSEKQPEAPSVSSLRRRGSDTESSSAIAQVAPLAKPLPTVSAEPVLVHPADRRLIVANWKANATLRQAVQLAEAANKEALKHPRAEVVLCPPNIYGPLLRHGIERLALKFGVQDISATDIGAHTGELPAPLAAQFASYALIGHSERRAAGENDQAISQKVAACLRSGIMPIICVGDRLIDRQHQHARRRIHDQLAAALHYVVAEELDQLVIAYEPVWAISNGDGHGNFASPDIVTAMVEHIRSDLRQRFGEAGSVVPLLYGGSVNADNARMYLNIAGIKGLLVGGASLDAHEFANIIEAI